MILVAVLKRSLTWFEKQNCLHNTIYVFNLCFDSGNKIDCYGKSAFHFWTLLVSFVQVLEGVIKYGWNVCLLNSGMEWKTTYLSCFFLSSTSCNNGGDQGAVGLCPCWCLRLSWICYIGAFWRRAQVRRFKGLAVDGRFGLALANRVLSLLPCFVLPGTFLRKIHSFNIRLALW